MNRLVAIVATFVLISGCASFQQHQTEAKLVTQYAVLKYAEQIPADKKAERVARIRAIATDVKSAAQGEVSLLVLREFVGQELDKANLSPADRLLADGLVQIVADELQVKIGEGVLSPEQRVQVAAVMDWIIQATALA